MSILNRVNKRIKENCDRTADAVARFREVSALNQRTLQRAMSLLSPEDRESVRREHIESMAAIDVKYPKNASTE